MKQKSIYLVIIIFVLVAFELAQTVFGNPIVVEPKERPLIRISILIGMFFLGAWIESAYFKSTFHQPFETEYRSKSNYNLFLKINLVTFPLTQVIAYFFYIYFSLFFWVYVIIIEIGVVFIETQLLRIELKRMVAVEVSSKIILRRTFFANLISFLVGLLTFFPSIF